MQIMTFKEGGQTPHPNTNIPWRTEVTPQVVSGVNKYIDRGPLYIAVAHFVDREHMQINTDIFNLLLEEGVRFGKTELDSIPYYTRVPRVILAAEEFVTTGKNRYLELISGDRENEEYVGRIAQESEVSIEEAKGVLEDAATVLEVTLDMYYGMIHKLLTEERVDEAVKIIIDHEIPMLEGLDRDRDKEAVRRGGERLIQVYNHIITSS